MNNEDFADSKDSVSGGKRMRRDPKMPKKPLSAYIYFSQETREQIKKENPKMQVSNIMKEVSNRWSSMTKEQKGKYATEAKNDKKRYEKELSMINKNKLSEPPSKVKNSDTEVSHKQQKCYDIDNEYETPLDFKNQSVSKLDITNQRKSHANDTKPSVQVYRNETGFKQTEPNYFRTLVDKNTEATKPPIDVQNDTISIDEPKFFSFPSVKNTPELVMNNPHSPLIKTDANSFVGGSNLHHIDTSKQMYTNRFNPFSNTIGQSMNVNVNRNTNYSNRQNEFTSNVNYTPSQMIHSPAINPFGNYGMGSVSPSGFTPIRTNLQRHSPMFSPANVSYQQYLNTSPNMNSMSGQTFGYQRTPVNTFSRPSMQMPSKQNMQHSGMQNSCQTKGNNEDDIFALNPFS